MAHCHLRRFASALIVSLPFLAHAAPPATFPEALTVYLDLAVEDGGGRPVLNLTPEDIVVMQDGVRQQLATLRARPTPGQYELSYAPASGQAGLVSLRIARPGAWPHGVRGDRLEPRVVRPLSAVGKQLAQVLATRPDANDFPSTPAALHFEDSAEGVHHTLAVEVPLPSVPTPGQDRTKAIARLQLLVIVRDDESRILHTFEIERPVPPGLGQRVLWTAQVHLRPGNYRLDTVACDPDTARLSVRALSWSFPAAAPGPRLSSLALLLPTGAVRLHGQLQQDDPFVVAGTTLMPTLSLRASAAPDAGVSLFAVVYPDRTLPEPPALHLALLRDAAVVAGSPLSLPTPNERGELRVSAVVPLQDLAPGTYQLRLTAAQGDRAASEEATFTVVAESPARAQPSPTPAETRPPVRLGPASQ